MMLPVALVLLSLMFMPAGSQTQAPAGQQTASPIAEELWAGARAGDAARVTAALDKGADVNAKTRYGATALTFAREGAKLIIADMNADGGQQTVHMITENGGEAIFFQTDVTQATAVEALISKAVDTYGRLDCAHNNAGISGAGIGGDFRMLTAEYPEERWQQVIAINLTGVWLCIPAPERAL